MAKKGIGGLKTGDTSLWLCRSAGRVAPHGGEFLLVRSQTVNRRQRFKFSAIAADCSKAASSFLSSQATACQDREGSRCVQAIRP